MPSNRRLKFFAATAAIVLLTVFYVTSSASASNQEFYDRTVAGLEARYLRDSRNHPPVTQPERATENVQRPVKEASEDNRGNVHGKGRIVAQGGGRVPPIDEEGPAIAAPTPLAATGDGADPAAGAEDRAPGKEGEGLIKTRLPPQVALGSDGDRKGVSGEKWNMGNKGGENEEKESEEDIEVKEVLNEILKKAPIIVFSKSYCPYSKKAKHILAQYEITPAPYIVELDEHQLGAQLQDKLHKITGRRTVPNVIVNGISIGGGDDVEALHDKGVLIDTIKEFAGKKITEARLLAGNVRRRMV